MSNANVFRTLNADEIEVRIQQVIARGDKAKANLLLYKNARVDMDMLDERFGCLGWQREHTFKEGKNYCTVSVYDADKQMWISKEDVGVESNTEETKGEASDSFKRACVNLGIGRELYSSPNIVIDLENKEWRTNEKTGRAQANSWVKFRVASIIYNPDRRIIGLSIIDSNGNIRFVMGESNPIASARPAPSPSYQRKTLTTDALLDQELLERLCKWVHGRIGGGTVADVINQYYDCDNETIDNITNEYNRTYGSN